MAPKKRAARKQKRPYGGGSEYRDKRTGRLVAAFRIGGRPVAKYAADTSAEAEQRLGAWRQALQALVSEGYDLAAIPRETLLAMDDPHVVATWRETVATFDRHHTRLSSAAETVQQFAERWQRQDLAHREGRTGEGLAAATVRAYRQSLELYILPTFGQRAMRDMLDTYAIETWAAQVRGEIGARSARNAWTVLQDMLGTAVRWKVLPYHPMRESKPPRAVGRTPHPLSVAELRRLFAAVEDHPWALVYHVAALLGLRLGECLGLLWAGVDWQAATLTVSGQVQAIGGTQRQPRTKSGKSRTIPIPPQLLAALRRHYEAQRELAKAATWREHGLIVTSRTGTPVVPRNMEQHWAGDAPDWKPNPLAKSHKKTREIGARELAGLPPDVVFHDLRHTCGALLVDVGASDAVRRVVLGHAGGTVTDHYSHALPALVRRAVEDVERLVWAEAAPAQRTK